MVEILSSRFRPKIDIPSKVAFVTHFCGHFGYGTVTKNIVALYKNGLNDNNLTFVEVCFNVAG